MYIQYATYIQTSFFYTSGPMQPDCCKLSVLLTVSYAMEKLVIVSALSSMLPLGRSCQQISNSNLMQDVKTYFAE